VDNPQTGRSRARITALEAAGATLAGMALVFGPHDENGFLAARASLLE
jgi:hypothetical protein